LGPWPPEIRADLAALPPWRHSSDEEAIDKNYVAHLPVIDRLFGTFYMPKDKQIWPRRYGTVGVPLPKGIVRQFFYPFRPHR